MSALKPLSCSAIILAIALGACSGGGGINVPTADDQVSLSRSNAEAVASNAFSKLETMLKLAAAPSSLLRNVERNGNSSFSLACQNGGVADYQFTDVDQSGTVSATDTVRVDLRDCALVEFGSAVNGELFMEVSRRTRSDNINGGLAEGTLTATDLRVYYNDELLHIVDGEFQTVSHTELLSSRAEASSQGSVTFTDPATGKVDSLSGFSFAKENDNALARYNISARGQVRSEQVSGSYSFAGDQAISGVFERYPDEGSIQVVGQGGDRAGLRANLIVNSESASVQYVSGSEVQEASLIAWSDLYSSFLWGHRFDRPPVTTGETNLVIMNLVRQFPLWPFVSRTIIPSDVLFIFQFDQPVSASGLPDFTLRSGGTPETINLIPEVNGALLVLRPANNLAPRDYEGPILDGVGSGRVMSTRPEIRFGAYLQFSGLWRVL